jgi:hypothetical protein
VGRGDCAEQEDSSRQRRQPEFEIFFFYKMINDMKQVL